MSPTIPRPDPIDRPTPVATTAAISAAGPAGADPAADLDTGADVGRLFVEGFVAPPVLNLLMRLQVQVGPAIELGECADGVRRVIPITGGRFEGKLPSGQAFAGHVLSGGADHQRIVGGTTAHMEARYVLAIDEPFELAGALVNVFNRATRHASPENTARLMRGELVSAENVYFRGAPCLDSAHPRFAWLRDRVFVCAGQRLPQAVHLQFFSLD